MFIDDLVTLIADAGYGTRGVNLFWSSGALLPQKTARDTDTGVNHDGFITIQETGGTAPLLVHNSEGYERPAAQIVTRANSYTAARTLSKTLWNLFVKRRNLTINGTWYISIDVSQSPFDLGPDDVNRVRVAFNVHAIKRPS